MGDVREKPELACLTTLIAYVVGNSKVKLAFYAPLALRKFMNARLPVGQYYRVISGSVFHRQKHGFAALVPTDVKTMLAYER